MPDTPAPILPKRRCAVCRTWTPYVYRWDKLERCRECLRDILLRVPRGARRRKLLLLLDGPDYAQGELNFTQEQDHE